MGKKDKEFTNQQTTKTKTIKNLKTKNKEMFSQLKTHEQKKIQNFNHKSSQIIHEEMNNQEQQNSSNNNEQLQINENNKDIQKICEVVHQLFTKNKINIKNAFEVPFINLQELHDFNKISQTQNGWSKVSTTLEADSKIYSYRIDAIHTIAYKIMNTMTRNQDIEKQPEQQEQKIKQGQPQNNNQNLDNFEIATSSLIESVDVSTHLQKNKSNLNMQEINKLSQFNPTYERTRRRFDQSGLKGMLLNNIQIDANMELSLNETRKVKPSGFYHEAMPVNVDELKEQIEICKSIESLRKSVFDTIGQKFEPSIGFQQNWRNINKGELNCQINNPQYDHAMDIQPQQEKNYGSSFRKIQHAIKLKTQKKASLKSTNQIGVDGLSWLSEMDKKMLGIQAPVKRTISNMSKPDRNEDDIDFQMGIQMLQSDVFGERPIQKRIQEYYEDTQQKNLLPLKLFHKFKVDQIMTLRQQPFPIIQSETMEIEEQNMQQQQRQQIDMKRQQMSIRQSKQKLKSIMSKQIDFKNLCKKFEINQKNVTPQLCFLTVLHLANQNNLKLEQSSDFNFFIKS